MKHILNIFLTVLSLTFLSCSKHEGPAPEPPVPPEPQDTSRTILVYMAANNTLGTGGFNTKDIAEMAAAAQSGGFGNGRLIIFHAPPGGSRVLMEMDRAGNLDTLKTYADIQYVISADFMLTVFRDAKAAAPAKDYGLVLWSHALGWTQNGQSDDGPTITPATWGDDRGHTMNITTLKRVLEAEPWSWVYFDCCYMGSVEVAYELRSVIHQMVASASEIPVDGMPYDRNLPLLFATPVDLEGAAYNTFNYYDSQKGESRTCTISVIDLSGMDELAEATKPIYGLSTAVGTDNFVNLPLSLDTRPLFYDFGVYVKGLCQKNDIEPALLDNWQAAYDKVVRVHLATPQLWNRIDLSGFTGMSTFIARSKSETSLRGYNTLSWYTDVASLLFDKDQHDL